MREVGGRVEGSDLCVCFCFVPLHSPFINDLLQVNHQVQSLAPVLGRVNNEGAPGEGTA